jgi:hypothetical protein
MQFSKFQKVSWEADCVDASCLPLAPTLSAVRMDLHPKVVSQYFAHPTTQVLLSSTTVFQSKISVPLPLAEDTSIASFSTALVAVK